MSVRATLRGTHEGMAEPRVVGGGGSEATLEHPRDGRATLRTAPDNGSTANPAHTVLLRPLDHAPAGRAGERIEVVIDGWRFEVEVEPEQRAALRERATRDRGEAGQSGPIEVRAIIPGVVVAVGVAQGDAGEAGPPLRGVEAMKMQNELRAPRAGTVQQVAVGERATIEVGDLLVVIE